MNSQDNRYDKTAPWKSRRNESNSRDSPDGYRKRNDSKHYNYYKDRRYYDNRSWKDSPYGNRHSYDTIRYRYERKAESSDDKTGQHEDERTEAVSNADKETKNYTSKKRWNTGTSPTLKPQRPAWLIEQKPLETTGGAYGPEPFGPLQTSFSTIFNHINTVYIQNNPTQPDSPMSFIDRLIADEAMRMLAAASSNETTTLNEPCEAAETVPANSAAAAAAASELTGTSSQQDTAKAEIDIKTARKIASVSAADSKLLQKSAEQVTKKLINRLSSMSKYDLKHMIDNPAGKYERALNRHAQNKLRAEVRKQLKSFGLNELGSACVTGDGTVESDEAIDADKIPSALLEQIEQALDLNFFDVTQPESNKLTEEQVSVGAVAPLAGDDELVETIQSGEQTVLGTKSTVNSSPDATNAKRNIDDFSKYPTTTSTKNGNDSKASTLSPGCKKKNIIRKKGNVISNGKDTAISPEQPNARKATVPVARVSNNAPIVSEDTNTNEKLNSVEDTIPTPLEANSGTRNASFLRVSTVEELNRRLDGIHGTQSADNQPKDQDPVNAVPERMLPNDGTTRGNEELAITNPTLAATTSEMPRPTVTCTADGTRNAQGSRQDLRAVNTNTVKVIRQNTMTKAALLDYIINKKGGKRVRLYRRPCGGESETVAKNQTTTSNFAGDQSTTPVPQTVLPDTNSSAQMSAVKRYSPKKRKFPQKKKLSSPAVVDASMSTSNVMASNARNKNPVKGFTKAKAPSTVKQHRLAGNKNGKVDRPKPLDSTKHSYSPVQRSPEKRAPTPQPPEQISFEDRLLNTAYDEYVNKGNDDRTAPEAVVQQTSPKSHITIANVCSMSGTVATSNCATNDRTEPDTQQLPQDSFLAQSIDDTPRASENTDQNVQNAVISTIGTETNLPDWNLITTETEMAMESKEEIERIDSPQPSTAKSTEEYILGGDSQENCVGAFIQTAPPDRNAIDDPPQEQMQYSNRNDAVDPLPISNTATLQSLCAITEHMQSIETQTIELYNRKMQIDAMFMRLHAERMDIDQQLERLHNIRSEQINFMRMNLLELSSSPNGTGGSATQDNRSFATVGSAASCNGVAVSPTVNQPGQTGSSSSNSAQVGARQQERTIRRITPIGGNSELMKIFQRRRVPSERSMEETSSVDQA